MSAAGRGADTIAALLLTAVVVALAVNVTARTMSLPFVGGDVVAQLAFAWLGVAGLLSFARDGIAKAGLRPAVAAMAVSFAAAKFGWGAAEAAEIIGGTEPVIGVSKSLRFAICASLAAASIVIALVGSWGRVLGVAAGLALASAAPQLPIAWGAVLFAALIAVRVPVALALLAAAAAADLGFSEAAFAQTVLRGLTPSVLLAVPLFILAASLLVASGLAGQLVDLARRLTRRRASGMAEANVVASTLFGGLSGSSLADAALGGRLLVPAMTQAGYRPSVAISLTAATAMVPNILPPSIALLLAAAATDQSVGALWIAGVGAGTALASLLWIAARFTPRTEAPAFEEPELHAASSPDWIIAAAPLLGIAAILLGLRAGLVTATEAGLIAVGAALCYTLAAKGFRAARDATVIAALQTSRIALLIAAVAPLTFLIATSGLDITALLGGATGWNLALLALAIALVAGTVLDVGAAILLLLPLLLPVLVEAGFHPLQATLAVTMVLLAGGLTPPVGLLVITVAEVSGSRPAWLAALPYLAVVLLAAFLILCLPVLTVWLPAHL